MDSIVYLEPMVDSLIVSTMEKLSTLPGDIDLGGWIQLFALGMLPLNYCTDLCASPRLIFAFAARCHRSN